MEAKNICGKWLIVSHNNLIGIQPIQPTIGTKKWFKVEEDYEYSAKEMKTKIKAYGGAERLVKVLAEYQNETWIKSIYNNVREAKII